MLYRHWSLFDAMYYSPYIASKLSMWQSNGVGKLQELLAKVGMPLQQCRQSYNFMNPALRSHFRAEITKESTKKDYGLDQPDVMYRSFYRFNSFRNPVAACDVVLAASALVELCRSDDYDSNTDVSERDKITPPPKAYPSQGLAQSRLDAFNQAYD